MQVDIWLYGPLARYADSDNNVFANVKPHLAEGTTLAELLAHLELPTEELGITFINGNLSAMPGVQPDLDYVLQESDRVALFHLKSMWPFQYRHDAAAIPEMKTHLEEREDGGMRSRFDTEEPQGK